jgi:type IV secretion system protein VirD4
MSKVEFIVDEFPLLGHMDAIENAVGIGRGYGIRLHLYVQSLGQLRKCFPEGQEQTLLSNCTQIYFSVNDNGTAEIVSARLGDETIIVESGGTSRGSSSSMSTGSHASSSQSNSSNTNHNWNQQARRLLKPEEVIALPPRVAITFTPGLPPIRTTTVRSYEEKNLGALARSPNELRRPKRELVKWASRFVITSLLAFVLSGALQDRVKEILADGGWRQSSYREQGVNYVGSGKTIIRWPEGSGSGRSQYFRQ